MGKVGFACSIWWSMTGFSIEKEDLGLQSIFMINEEASGFDNVVKRWPFHSFEMVL